MDGCMVGCSMDKDSMDSESKVGMVGRLDRMGKLGKMDIGNVGVVFCVVFFHNCHNRIHSHHHRICQIDHNQIVSIFFPPFDLGLGYAM